MSDTDQPLAEQLLAKYLELLRMSAELPSAMCFYGDGVKVLVEQSPVLDALRALEDAGVHLIACQTCLDYFDIRDRMKVGLVGGMGDIIEAQLMADKVITI